MLIKIISLGGAVLDPHVDFGPNDTFSTYVYVIILKIKTAKSQPSKFQLSWDLILALHAHVPIISDVLELRFGDDSFYRLWFAF